MVDRYPPLLPPFDPPPPPWATGRTPGHLQVDDLDDETDDETETTYDPGPPPLLAHRDDEDE